MQPPLKKFHRKIYRYRYLCRYNGAYKPGPSWVFSAIFYPQTYYKCWYHFFITINGVLHTYHIISSYSSKSFVSFASLRPWFSRFDRTTLWKCNHRKILPSCNLEVVVDVADVSSSCARQSCSWTHNDCAVVRLLNRLWKCNFHNFRSANLVDSLSRIHVEHHPERGRHLERRWRCTTWRPMFSPQAIYCGGLKPSDDRSFAVQNCAENLQRQNFIFDEYYNFQEATYDQK